MNEQNFFYESDDMIDISSSSKGVRPTQDKRETINPVKAYGNGLFKHLGTIIKFIAFMIAFFIIAVSFVVAIFLYSPEKFFMTLSIGIIIVGTAVGLITLFLIYGIGHVICQNNEILRRLDDNY